MANVPPQGGRKHPEQQYIQVDTSNILFICGGTFVGLDQIIGKRLGRKMIGFGSEAAGRVEAVDDKGKLLLKAVVEALQKWLVDLSLAKNGLPIRYFLPQQATISGLADIIPAVRLIHFYRDVIKRRQEAEQPLNARLFLEGVFLDYRALFAN